MILLVIHATRQTVNLPFYIGIPHYLTLIPGDSCAIPFVLAWYPGLGIGLRQRLDTIQRKMVRFVNGWKPRSHVGIPEINAVGWLYFPERVKFFKLCHLFKVKKGLAPSYLSRDFVPTRNIHSHLTRGSDLNNSADSHEFLKIPTQHFSLLCYSRLEPIA